MPCSAACSRSEKRSRRCRPTCVRGHPGVPWSDIARMRDVIGHHYYKLDSEIVRATIGEPVEALRVVCQGILAESAGQDEAGDEP
jgi:uncharacterized protein with HEPN domain